MSFMPPHWQVGSLKLVSPGTTRIDKTKYEGPLEYVFKNKHFVFSGYVTLLPVIYVLQVCVPLELVSY